MGYPSFKDEEGKGYDKRDVSLADPLLSSYRKRITGTAGVMGFTGLGVRQGLDEQYYLDNRMNEAFCR